MDNGKKVALISGANKGIGFQIARQLGQKQITVLVGARSEEAGNSAVTQLKDERVNAQFLLLDLDNLKSIDNASDEIAKQFGKLDILINNAAFQNFEGQLPSEIKETLLEDFMKVNFMRHVYITQRMLPLLKLSEAGRIVNMSSSLGSATIMSEPGHINTRRNLLGYSAAKAALNMYTILLAKELKVTSVKVNAADPGWSKTDLGGKDATQTAEKGAEVATWLACLDNNGPTGGFFGNQIINPW